MNIILFTMTNSFISLINWIVFYYIYGILFFKIQKGTLIFRIDNS